VGSESTEPDASEAGQGREQQEETQHGFYRAMEEKRWL